MVAFCSVFALTAVRTVFTKETAIAFVFTVFTFVSRSADAGPVIWEALSRILAFAGGFAALAVPVEGTRAAAIPAVPTSKAVALASIWVTPERRKNVMK